MHCTDAVTRGLCVCVFNIQISCAILGKPLRRCDAWLTDMGEKQTELEIKNK